MSKKILIVDDSAINQEILADIVATHYEHDEAYNGQQALDMIYENPDLYSIILLDLNMPVLDGYAVLDKLNMDNMLENLPVVVISSETDGEQIDRAYEKGAIDFINRPFNGKIVLRRVSNTLALYSTKSNLENLIIKSFYEKEKSYQNIIETLANLVEFKDGTNNEHNLHIRSLTATILHTLKDIAPQYNLKPSMVSRIINASSLHDVGMHSIPKAILEKPGKLTDEEYIMVKKHAENGSSVFEKSTRYSESKTIKIARDICRWHHERFDGKGYPDGLKGDEIPIEAQVVGLADVYEALTNKRCYKESVSHEKAVEMILNGECGAFNPILLEVLKIIAPTLPHCYDQDTLYKAGNEEIRQTARNLLDSINMISNVIL